MHSGSEKLDVHKYLESVNRALNHALIKCHDVKIKVHTQSHNNVKRILGVSIEDRGRIQFKNFPEKITVNVELGTVLDDRWLRIEQFSYHCQNSRPFRVDKPPRQPAHLNDDLGGHICHPSNTAIPLHRFNLMAFIWCVVYYARTHKYPTEHQDEYINIVNNLWRRVS